MDLVALGNFYMEEEHTIYTYDKLEPYIKINTEDKDNRQSEELDTSVEESLIYDIDGDDDYWNFIENPRL